MNETSAMAILEPYWETWFGFIDYTEYFYSWHINTAGELIMEQLYREE